MAGSQSAFEITGDKALDAALSLFPTKFVNKAVKGSIKDAQKNITLKEAQKDKSWTDRTRFLRRSLRVRVAKRKGNKRLSRGVVGYAVSSVKTKTIDAFYSPWVFLGATNRDGSKREGTRTLRRALYDNARELLRSVRNDLKAALPRIAEEVRAATQAKG